MIYWLFCMFLSAALFAQSAPQSSTSTGNPVPNAAALFLINPMQRGSDIVKLFSTLSTGIFKNPDVKGVVTQIAIQTTRNGLINNVFGIDFAKNYTILIIKYYGSPNGRGQYIVVPVEQIVEVIYSWTTVAVNNGNYVSAQTTGILPYYNMNMLERAEDIVDIYSILSNPNGNFFNAKKQTKFQIQTTLSGPYYAQPPNANGLISYVIDVSLNSPSNGNFLLVTYELLNNQKQDFYIVVPTDQVYGINSTYNYLNQTP